jgi:hypothetical protein
VCGEQPLCRTQRSVAAGIAASLEATQRYGKPQEQRTRTLEALVQQLLGLAAFQPVLVVLEDAHWIDPTTLELIEQWVDTVFELDGKLESRYLPT